MKQVYLIDHQGIRKIFNIGTLIHSGGAGGIHSLQGNSELVVKIYHEHTLKNEGEEYSKKIEQMLRSPPALSSSDKKQIQIAWPRYIAKDTKGKFVGFAMPSLELGDTECLESLLQPKQATLKGIRSDLGARITVAANLAIIIRALHEKKYQIVDLKPPNLQFYRKELNVVVLDCDGFNIGNSFQAPQITVDYLAPEYQGTHQISAPENQDNFALATIIFRLLNFGIHPYTSKANKSGVPTDLEGRIKQNLYAYSIKGHSKVTPLPISAHECLPHELRNLFDRAFGLISNRRPNANEWATILEKFAQPRTGLIQKCDKGHWWFKDESCGECHRKNGLNYQIKKTNPKTKLFKSTKIILPKAKRRIVKNSTIKTNQHLTASNNSPNYTTYIFLFVVVLSVALAFFLASLLGIFKSSPSPTDPEKKIRIRSESQPHPAPPEVSVNTVPQTATPKLDTSEWDPNRKLERPPPVKPVGTSKNTIPAVPPPLSENIRLAPNSNRVHTNQGRSTLEKRYERQEIVTNNRDDSQSLAPEPPPRCDPEKVYAMEVLAQYHGDDPIVRERMGLPPPCKGVR